MTVDRVVFMVRPACEPEPLYVHSRAMRVDNERLWLEPCPACGDHCTAELLSVQHRDATSAGEEAWEHTVIVAARPLPPQTEQAAELLTRALSECSGRIPAEIVRRMLDARHLLLDSHARAQDTALRLLVELAVAVSALERTSSAWREHAWQDRFTTVRFALDRVAARIGANGDVESEIAKRVDAMRAELQTVERDAVSKALKESSACW